MADDFFNNGDPFDDLVRQFFGHSPAAKRSSRVQRRTQVSEEDLSSGEIIEEGDRVYLIFEIPGFSEKDITVSAKNDILEIKAQKKVIDEVQNYFSSKLQAGVIIRRSIPEELSKKFTHTYKNGILEVVFEK